jgi:taurine dioxygenase
MANKLSITPVGAFAGALIDGINLARPLEAGTAKQVRKALAEHGVIFFRNQTLTPEQHLAFARIFGPITTITVIDGSCIGCTSVLIDHRRRPRTDP